MVFKNTKFKELLKKIWYFVCEDKSIWSWIVNLILAFIIVYFVIYPGLGLLFGTALPVVAVVSESMEHNGLSFDEFYQKQASFYEGNNIKKEDFREFTFKNGFNKGDIMVLFKADTEKIKIGAVIVYHASYRDPVIHRVVKISIENEGNYYMTKGDNVPEVQNFEKRIYEKDLLGRAVLRIPYLGWVKIGFMALFRR